MILALALLLQTASADEALAAEPRGGGLADVAGQP